MSDYLTPEPRLRPVRVVPEIDPAMAGRATIARAGLTPLPTHVVAINPWNRFRAATRAALPPAVGA